MKILDHRVIEEDFLAENDVLWLMRQVEHKHLMKPIAAYVMGPKRAFILPWAEGNLNDLWARQEVEPYDKPAWTRWFLKQMRNLADAISLLYDEPEYCVHQSFAPSNIMWLDGNNISLSEDEEFGILLVGNSGITKQCVGELDLAKESGSRYLAPEATGGFTRINGEIEGIDGLVQSGSIHRRLSKVNFNFADSWSLGCICLEFIVWLLCGYPDLMAFREQTAEGFYQSGGRRRQYVQHRVVRAKIHDLKTHPLCTQSRPIGALLRLIQTRLLTVKTTARWMRAGSPPLPQTSHRTTTRNLWEWLCLACMVVESEDSEFSGVLPNFESRMKHMAQTASASGGAAMYFQQDDLREDTSTPLDESEAQEEPDSNSSDRDTDEL